jgi:hypothetical protein
VSTTTDRIASEIRVLPDIDKLKLVDAILADLDKPDPDLDKIWVEEARARWTAYKDGHADTVAYEDVMRKYQQS